MKIKFMQGHRPAGDAPDIPTYKQGEVYDFPGPVAETYARKYIDLGLAVEAKDEPKPAPKVEEQIEKPAEKPAEQPRQTFTPRQFKK